MSIENEFGFIGWCHDPVDNHDKIWGYFYRPTPGYMSYWGAMTIAGATKGYGWNCCIFWARRGRAMQFKTDSVNDDLAKLVNSKLKKGYVKISAQKLVEIWPTFISEAEGKLMWDILAGKVV